MRVRFIPQAERQYLEALRCLMRSNAACAVTVQKRAEAVIDLLREHPRAGHVISEFPDLSHRELLVPPYRFFHRVVADSVWIVAVRHARQRLERPGSSTTPASSMS